MGAGPPPLEALLFTAAFEEGFAKVGQSQGGPTADQGAVGGSSAGVRTARLPQWGRDGIA
eukprot:7585764-Pyramimonas_sp.AAC.1